jgi:hypothetical protein
MQKEQLNECPPIFTIHSAFCFMKSVVSQPVLFMVHSALCVVRSVVRESGGHDAGVGHAQVREGAMKGEDRAECKKN